MEYDAHRIGTSFLRWLRVEAEPRWREEKSILCAFQTEAPRGGVRFLVGIFPLTPSETCTPLHSLRRVWLLGLHQILRPLWCPLTYRPQGGPPYKAYDDGEAENRMAQETNQRTSKRTQKHTRVAQAHAGATVRVRQVPTHSRGLASHPSFISHELHLHASFKQTPYPTRVSEFWTLRVISQVGFCLCFDIFRHFINA